VNTALARLSGELCDGFQVHPFHSPEYVRAVVKPAIAEGASRASGRDPNTVELTTSVFVVTGDDEDERSRQREEMRSQAAFYASTPSYRVVLEAHGWGEVGERLTSLAREKKWGEMPGLVTDEMLRAFSVEAAPEDLGGALRERYDGLLDRITVYAPFVPGERDAFWRSVIDGVRADPP
jgi:probable F420-dependent oxidoreductase